MRSKIVRFAVWLVFTLAAQCVVMLLLASNGMRLQGGGAVVVPVIVFLLMGGIVWRAMPAPPIKEDRGPSGSG